MAFLKEVRTFLDRHADHPQVASLRNRLAVVLSRSMMPELLALHEETLTLAEDFFWDRPADSQALSLLQALYREHQQLRNLAPQADKQHSFVVVIPVADRPQQLRNCLQSLLDLCCAFEYGGKRDGGHPAVSVVIAEDSEQETSRQRHAELAGHYRKQGLDVFHFDLPEQQALWRGLPAASREALAGALGEGESITGHKGPSRTRNLMLLYLNRLAHGDSNPLFFFLDSDEAFRVLHCGPERRRELVAVNYFHHFDRIFSLHQPVMVTGKVVGDPPVAPAVMAGNFLQDVGAFLSTVGCRQPTGPCCFHEETAGVEGAAYHDMADLFGFSNVAEPYSYHCDLDPPHDNQSVFADFAARLDRFFDGGHPTRVTCYRHQPVLESLQPARTVYTGNYVFSTEGLQYFIPFAGLRLRMAGPTLGRLLKAELGERFLSANLPLLHSRTLESAGVSEYRPGVARRTGKVDLAGEFERQFYGDLMLFAVERLTEEGYPARQPGKATIEGVITTVLSELDERYAEKQRLVGERVNRVGELLENASGWWHNMPRAEAALADFRRFLGNIKANFGADSPALRQITDPAGRRRRLQQMADAIESYPREQAAWRELIAG